jgi:D-sedoheptulose 7-phosphate isomerase
MPDQRKSGPLKEQIAKEIEENIAVTTELARSLPAKIAEAANLIVECLRTGGKVLVFGNGGSAAEAEHFVAELVGRYRLDRQPLTAIALTTDSGVLTSIANDYGFDQVFARQLRALARSGDIAIAISTSGNSPNILEAVDRARSMGLVTLGLTGATGGKLAGRVQLCLKVPSDCTARIQEAHALLVHLLCGLVENALQETSDGHAGLNSSTGQVR